MSNHHPSRPPARRGLLRAALALGFSAALLPAAQATQPIKQNLTQLVAAAEIVVSGTVLRVSDGLQGKVPYTEITLQVKGSARQALETGGEYTFRQWGLLTPRRLADGRFMLPMQISGMPKWSVGEQVMVFLNPAASMTGLRSPVGLSQGKFSTIDGRAANGLNNFALFEGVEISAPLSPEEQSLLRTPGGPVDESTLMNLVTRAIDGRWTETGVMR